MDESRSIKEAPRKKILEKGEEYIYLLKNGGRKRLIMKRSAGKEYCTGKRKKEVGS